jgi:pyridoxal phosphate enzyme (YggS family)
MSDVAHNLRTVRARIDAAARRAGRDPSSVRLLAVGKTKPAADLAEAYAAGQREFGENYAQELVDKHAALAHLPGIAWHFIGRLQSNKAKIVAPIAALIHAVDSERLAIELGKRAVIRATPLPVLVEVNVGGETSKGGVEAAELGRVLDRIASIASLHLEGLMSIPPPTETAEASRVHHRRLRTLRDEHGGAARLPTLSMGMTDDLEVAIEEGATIVRVGTAIFGARAKPQP